MGCEPCKEATEPQQNPMEQLPSGTINKKMVGIKRPETPNHSFIEQTNTAETIRQKIKEAV